MQIKIDPQFKSFMPALSDVERANLKRRIQREGCLEPLVVWLEQGILIDGHNRHEICLELGGLSFDVRELSFPNRDAVLDWIRITQMSRRNLSDKWQLYFIGADYISKKRPVGNPNLSNSATVAELENNGKTAKEIADKHKVSERTVHRAAELAGAVNDLPDEERKKVLDSDKPVAEIVGQGKPSKPKDAKQKPGKPKWSWKDYEKNYGCLVRAIDDLGRSYGVIDTKGAVKTTGRSNELRTLLGKFDDVFRKYQEELEAKK